MLRTIVFAMLVAFSLSSCGSTDAPVNSSAAQSTETGRASDSNTPTAAAQPKTLEAAVAAEQENADRYSSGDYAGQWLLYSRRLREAISQDDYVAYAERCVQAADRPEGLPLTVEGVRMDGDSTAFVRVGLLGIMKSRTIVYEDGVWLQEPTDEFAQNFGRPVAEWAC